MKKCPFCGTEQDADPGSTGAYTCGTQALGTTDKSYLRSYICYDRQLAQVQARIQELEGLIKQGAELLRVGALTNSYAVQEFLQSPDVKGIIRSRNV